MQEAKQGCLLGCAALATLLVAAEAGLLIYVARHREEWRRAAAAQTRAFVEEGTRRSFPEGVSTDSIQRLGAIVERGQLTAHPSKENLERLVESRARIENLGPTGAKVWAEYLLVLMETLFEGRASEEAFTELRARLETSEFQNLDAVYLQKWIEDLAAVAGSPGISSPPLMGGAEGED
jgi:hypothetical protein